MGSKQEMSDQEYQDLLKKPEHYFVCSCKDSQALEFKEFKNHLLEVHKLTPEQLKGNKQMIVHMDGTKWFSSTYKWTLESGLTFTEYYRGARKKSDPMSYNH